MSFYLIWTLTYQTLTVFLAGVLSKRYTNPSSDIIEVLAGLEQVDGVFTDFANVVEISIRNGRSCMSSICCTVLMAIADKMQWTFVERPSKWHCHSPLALIRLV